MKISANAKKIIKKRFMIWITILIVAIVAGIIAGNYAASF